MLAEIEEKLVTVLREQLTELPEESVLLDAKPSKLPAVTISSLGFRLEKSGMSETLDETTVEREERFALDGAQTVFKLKERPLKESLKVECPPGIPLTEGTDYTANVDEASISFAVAPLKTRKKLLVRYLAPGALRVKALKLAAKYCIEAWATDRAGADAVAEAVVKALLAVDDELALEGIDARPLGGRAMVEGEEKARGIRLLYVFERELRVERPVPTMAQIEVAGKKPLGV